MKHTILAVSLALTSTSLSADVVFEKSKNVDREVVVTFNEKKNLKKQIIEKILETERNRFSVHFSTFGGNEVDTKNELEILQHGRINQNGSIKPDVVLSNLVYIIKPCTDKSLDIVNAVCVKYQASVEIAINSDAFMDEGEVHSFNGRLSKASRLLLKRDG
ncbi:hypothetical protein [Alteromonas gracilis]|uniref:hypothetical protein n=1 Tax=Alteromonas gracilis TaxID=1479524 RepID=UPI003736A32A